MVDLSAKEAGAAFKPYLNADGTVAMQDVLDKFLRAQRDAATRCESQISKKCE
jgi:hypothetical protein